MMAVSATVPFTHLCTMLEGVDRAKGKDNKKKIFKEFLDKWREFHNSVHKDDPNTEDSFYPAMRLILPQCERERIAYGIKEFTLAKYYIEILGLAKDSPDALKLLKYRAPSHAKGEAGDFAAVAYFVLKNRCPEKGSLTIQEVNDLLDSIATNNAAKNKEEVRRSILKLLRSTSAMEQKWLIRMIMKELKMGMNQAGVFAVFHPDAEDLFNVTNSLAKVCIDLRDPRVRLNEIAISLFSPFKPMLGQRIPLDGVEKEMHHEMFYIETKFDGERMLLHKDGDTYKYFSRSGKDYTHQFGAHPLEGSLTPYIHNCFASHVKSCILDGEMVGYNPQTKAIMSKGDKFDIKNMAEDSDLQTMYCVFDILLLNGQKFANSPLRERVDYLDKLFTPIEGRLLLGDRKDARTKAEVIDALNEAIDRREEGLVIKYPGSKYAPDKRKGSGWLKVKPEYVDGLMDQVDVVIVGGYFGKGRRSHMISHFLCAVAVQPNTPGEKPALFHTFCRVGSGYTLKELYQMGQRLHPHWRVFDKKKPPKTNILFPSGYKEAPDVWIDPEQSLVVQIKAAEIIESDKFKTGCTLRFPRLEKVRDDKEWSDCMTLDELDDMRKNAEGKLASRHAGIDDSGEPSKKKRRTVVRVEKPITVAPQFKAADTSKVQQVSAIFEDREFCIINGPPEHGKADLERKVVAYGGTVVQAPGPDTSCVLAHKVNVRVNNIISGGKYDVVKADWLLRCWEAKQCLPWLPSHMIHMSPDTAAQFALEFDRHGDSFTDDATVDSLKEVFEKIGEEKSSSKVSSEGIAEMEEKYFPNESPLGLFRLCRLYVDNCHVIGDQSTRIKDCPLDLVALEVRFHGATVSPILDSDVTHVLFHTSDLSRLDEVKALRRQRTKKHHLVTPGWVYDCIQTGAILTERDYEPHSSTDST
ncbi:LIG4 [Branchiostoma lanceolatum]|nr:LIG4 [Branchiostoma lanceolatum]